MPMPSNEARRNLLQNEPIESFWDALWLELWPFLCFTVESRPTATSTKLDVRWSGVGAGLGGDRPRTEHEPVHDWFMNRFAGYGSVFTPCSGSHGSPVFTVRPVLARTGSRFALSVRFAAFMHWGHFGFILGPFLVYEGAVWSLSAHF